MLSQVLDHLWQSTLLALAVAGLALAALRTAPARVRHALWLIASVKFLVPFAALAAVGRLLAPLGFSPAAAAPEAALIRQTVKPLSQFPFAHSAALHVPLSPGVSAHVAFVPAPVVHAAPAFDLALVLLAAWAFGCGAVVMAWAVRWAQVSRIVRAARPVAWPAPMPVLASASLMEPGLVGLLRPVLVLPQTLPERLTRSEIDAILAHEISHLRRRDNLTAAVHMLVEAVFWFHPLVWWIGARLIDERERACDEAVVEAGHDRAAYARSLVESSRLYLQSPLSCVVGASGSNLTTRVRMIMTAPLASPLSPLKKALLLAAGACAFATPVTAGLLTSPQGRKVLAPVPVPTAGPAFPRAAEAVAADGAAAPALRSTAGADEAAAPQPVAITDRQVASIAGLTAGTADTAAALAEAPATEIAAVAPSSTLVPPVTVWAPADKAVLQQTTRFVQAYAAPTNPELDQIARWKDPVCVQVVGLAGDQGALVKARIETVAQQVGLPATRDGCTANVEVVFTPEPQKIMDAVAARREQLLGYEHRHSRDRLKTVTRPIQAWYATATLSTSTSFVGKDYETYREVVDDPINLGPSSCGISHIFSRCLQSVFRNVLIVADAKALEGKDLGYLADYMVMLTLSQPHSLGRCGALPSLLDMAAAACPGGEPDGLMPADAAFLTALYQADPEATTWVERGDIAGRMAKILTADKVASR